ncbi:MAG: nicotinate phosphoribosyltransferase, partial [Aquiluna sp.]
MLQAALRSGKARRQCVFEVFARHLPPGRRFGVVAGTGRVLEAITQFKFGEAELDYLRTAEIVDEPTLDYLADYRFQGQIEGYREGELYFADSPVLSVTGSFADSV